MENKGKAIVEITPVGCKAMNMTMKVIDEYIDRMLDSTESFLELQSIVEHRRGYKQKTTEILQDSKSTSNKLNCEQDRSGKILRKDTDCNKTCCLKPKNESMPQDGFYEENILPAETQLTEEEYETSNEVEDDNERKENTDSRTFALLQKKKLLKNKLKLFDKKFELKHGKKPNNEDKEAIRPLYEEYNALKLLLARCHSSNKMITNEFFQALLKEKRELQVQLRQFELDFAKQNLRKIKYNKDIQGLEEEYKRYRELKTQLSLIRKA